MKITNMFSGYAVCAIVPTLPHPILVEVSIGVAPCGLGDWDTLEGDDEYWIETTRRVHGFATVQSENGVYHFTKFLQIDPLWFHEINIDRSFIITLFYLMMVSLLMNKTTVLNKLRILIRGYH